MNRRSIAWAVGGVALAVLLAVALLPQISQHPADQVTIGGPFRLIDSHGQVLTDRDFRGRFMLVYFGYTHCPDACPTTLSDEAAALDTLPRADRAKTAPIFITVDPARDTPAIMGEYAHAFAPDFIGLTGSEQAITAAERAYHVYAARHPLKGGDYAMDHSSIIYVMGPDGVFRGVIEDNDKPAEMARALRGFGV